jgi:hypothetical protein
MGKEAAILAVLAIALVAAFAADAYRSQHEKAEQYGIAVPPAVEDVEAPAGIGAPGSAHHHSMFLVLLNGAQHNFTQQKHMLRAAEVHMENSYGIEIHTHATNVTLGYFFNTLNMTFNRTCFVLDDGTGYCNEDSHTLKFYVNGEPSSEYENHPTAEGEKYLIIYGNDSEDTIQKWLRAVPDVRSTINPNPVPEPMSL